MSFFDMPLEQLQTYRPERNEPLDFDSFWQKTLSAARSYALNAHFKLVDYGFSLLETYDVTFNGYGGQPIKGWFIVPKQRSGALPCIVEYIGYGGGRSFPHDWIHWATCGYAHLVMDTRGQGSTWRNGDTPDIAEGGYDAHYPGYMTRGIQAPETYYYRRVFTDAVRAIEAARSHEAVDASRIMVQGGSQGGGIAVAMAGLVHDLYGVLPDVPFLTHYRRAVEITTSHPYEEIRLYLKTHRDKVERVFQTLAYFDGMNFAARANAKALFSVALMDLVCPPSTIFAEYNHYAAPKELAVYEFNDHEGGGVYHHIRQIEFLRELLG